MTGRRIDLYGWAGLGVVLLIWQGLALWQPGASPLFVPLQDILAAGLELARSGDLWLNYRASLLRVAGGFSVGASIGFVLGALLASSAWAQRGIGPLFHAIRQVPMFGWVPLIGLWFGMGESAKTVLIALSTLYPVTLCTIEGVRRVPLAYREVAVLFRFNRWQVLRHVLVPAALPAICTGLRQGLGFAWISVVGAEMFMAASPGIGAMLVSARAQFRIDVLMLGMALIGGTGFAMNAAMGRVEAWLRRGQG